VGCFELAGYNKNRGREQMLVKIQPTNRKDGIGVV
jgi:hypothetical protein